MKHIPADIYNDAMRRALDAVRRGDLKAAERWTGLAERAHRIDARRSDSSRKNHRHELETEERRLRITAAKKAAAAPRSR